MIYENKFQIGDQVKSTISETKTGEVKLIMEGVTDGVAGYAYWIFNKDDNRYYCESENYLKLVKSTPEDDSDSVKVLRQIIESSGYESDLKVGDIVRLRDGLIGEYVVASVTETAHGEEVWQYELIPTAKTRTDETYLCRRLLLEYQYHDKSWEKVITESFRRNTLPKWRGELYNYFEVCERVGYTDDDLDKVKCEKYNNDTIPPVYMQHILHEHSVVGAIRDVVKGSGNIIKKSLRIASDMDLYNLRRSIEHKFNYRNKDWAEKVVGKDDLAKEAQKDYSADEMRLIGQVDIIDKEKNNKDHYPICMTHYQIMDAIKEAYEHSTRTSGKHNASEVDKRNPKAGDVPVENGAYEYEGYSSKYNLVIRFIYNFDLDCITTAFPIREEKNAKKYNPESYHRKRFSK